MIFARKLLNAIWCNDGFQSDTMRRWQPLYTCLFASRGTVLVLLLLGITRTIFFLQAYAPADGADANDYYTYAAYMSGIDLPTRVANLSPIYPFFIYINHYVLGNFHLIIFWQMVMSASLGVLYYLGLRRYNALLAVLVALMVIGDAQSGVIFNFTSTEPPYIFLLACIYALTLIQHQTVSQNVLQWRDMLLGVLLVLLRETRTIARYAIVPVWVLFALATRNWKRAAIVLLSYGVMSLLFSFSTQVAEIEQQSSLNDGMLLRPLLAYGLLDAEAGTASADLSGAVELCENNPAFTRIFACLEDFYGGTDAILNVINQAYVESVSERPLAIYRRMFEEFTNFLQLTGLQLQGTPTPADVQCADIPARIERQLTQTFNLKWDGLQVTGVQRENYALVAADFTQQMCPPAPTNATIHRITDYIALRYRSLSRPHPYRWYGTLIVFVLLIPWARKLWLPVFLAGGLLAYHAAINAALFNVQPRYALVTNPFKGILILSLLVILGYIALKIADYRLRRDMIES